MGSCPLFLSVARVPASGVSARHFCAIGLALAVWTGPVLAEALAGPQDARVAELAHEAPPLTLERAMALAMESNPGLGAARQALAASEGALLQSGARPNPELAYSQEDTRRDARSSTLQWSQTIETGGKREARMRMAERGLARARAELAEVQAGLRADVISAFFGLLVAQERVQLAGQTLDIARSAREAAAKRVAAGKVAPLEETKARVAESGAQLELAQARSEQRMARQRIQLLWGEVNPAFGAADGAVDALPAVPALADLQQRMQEAPAVLQARESLEQSRAAADLERARRLPDPTLSLGVKRARDNGQGQNQLVFGISVPLPILDSNRGNQIQALRLADKAEQDLQTARMQLQTRLFEAREQLQTSREQAVQLKSEVLPSAEMAYGLATKGFALGKFSYLEVLDAQRTLSAARGQYLDQLQATHRAAADIHRLLGSLAD
ncbi:TolC family protein [Comamonas composti]|uniref:TolC family protein n=1 Tax=Comamonas composti TaxID=408558 RepID=UPI0009FE073C|nr:TolC family protein [Comamonas composti]